MCLFMYFFIVFIYYVYVYIYIYIYVRFFWYQSILCLVFYSVAWLDPRPRMPDPSNPESQNNPRNNPTSPEAKP